MHAIDAARASKAGIAYCSPKHNVALLYCNGKFYRVDYYQGGTQITQVKQHAGGNWQPASDQFRPLIDNYEENLLKQFKPFGNMQIQEMLKQNEVTVKCDCNNVFRVLVARNTDSTIQTREGFVITEDNKPAHCTACGCAWVVERPAEEPPLPTKWMYYAVFVVLDGDTHEQLAVLGNAFNHVDFATKTLVKLLESYPVKSYRVIPVTFAEYTNLSKETTKERISQILAFLIG